jgi:hypothetical protein
MSNTLDNLFEDVEQASMPTESRLTWVTELDDRGEVLGYLLAGDVIDSDGAVCGVAEYTPKFDRAWSNLTYYTREFANVSVTFETKTFNL